jgi:putative transposase
MARKLRIEYEHALYHIINRGNYRADIFATDGAKQSFEKCLWETCAKCGWTVHAYVVMRNHYHLALETPQPNLVAGMKWLQATFANRFNRFRRERGHVFQGRYQAIVLEEGSGLGAVCHYIHLNPARAGVVGIGELERFRHGSYHWLNQPRKRPAGLDLRFALEAAGGLADNPAGRKRYQAYLAWLASDSPAQKALEFDWMSRGWAHGTKAFKKALAEDQRTMKTYGTAIEAETAEMRELAWESALGRCLRTLRHEEGDIAKSRKAAPWKVAIAARTKQISTVTNVWLAQRLNMGAPDGVSRYCAECRSGKRSDAARLLKEISDIMV